MSKFGVDPAASGLDPSPERSDPGSWIRSSSRHDRISTAPHPSISFCETTISNKPTYCTSQGQRAPVQNTARYRAVVCLNSYLLICFADTHLFFEQTLLTHITICVKIQRPNCVRVHTNILCVQPCDAWRDAAQNRTQTKSCGSTNEAPGLLSKILPLPRTPPSLDQFPDPPLES